MVLTVANSPASPWRAPRRVRSTSKSCPKQREELLQHPTPIPWVYSYLTRVYWRLCSFPCRTCPSAAPQHGGGCSHSPAPHSWAEHTHESPKHNTMLTLLGLLSPGFSRDSSLAEVPLRRLEQKIGLGASRSTQNSCLYGDSNQQRPNYHQRQVL